VLLPRNQSRHTNDRRLTPGFLTYLEALRHSSWSVYLDIRGSLPVEDVPPNNSKEVG